MSPNLHNSAAPEELVLKQNAGNMYVHDLNAATTTPFSRLITLQTIDSHSFRVNSKVTWYEHERDYAYDLETILYDWR